MNMDAEATREALIQLATERARLKLGLGGVPDAEEAEDAARWALTDLIMPRPQRVSNLDWEAFERGVQEVARRLIARAR